MMFYRIGKKPCNTCQLVSDFCKSGKKNVFALLVLRLK